MELNKINLSKILNAIYGGILILLAVDFYRVFGIKLYPPITSLVLIFGVTSIWILISSKNLRIIVFGENEYRKPILDLLGMIFTGFILMITLLWGLNPGALNPNVLYHQSSLLVLLFFYIIFGFLIILYSCKIDE